MKIFTGAKILSFLIVIFFAACAIIGFAAAEQYPYPDFQVYSNFFGINGICFMLLWIQVLYRFLKMNVQHVENNNKECFSSLEQLLVTTLRHQDFQFQKGLCSILAITLSYSSISLILTEQYVLILFWEVLQYRQYYYDEGDSEPTIYDENDLESMLKDQMYGSKDQFNAIVYMQVLSLAYGAYLQIQIIRKLFFQFFEKPKEEILLLNKNLPLQEEIQYRQDVVSHAFAFVFLWILILFLRLGVFVYISKSNITDFGYTSMTEILAQFAIYIYSETIVLIMYCLLLLYKLCVVKSQLEQNQENIINQNKDLFQGWFTLVSSLMYSEVMNKFSVLLLILMLGQSIFGFIVLSTKYTISTLNVNYFLNENLLLVDTIIVTILICIHFLKQLSIFLFPKTHPQVQAYQFIIIDIPRISTNQVIAEKNPNNSESFPN